MIPRQAPLAGAAAAVLDQRKHEGWGPKPAETVGFATGGRDLPARRRGAGWAAKKCSVGCSVGCTAGSSIRMQDEAEPAAFARRDGEPARCREIGLPACQFRHDGSHGAAFECLLHGPQGIPRTRHPQNGETPHGQTHEREPRPVRRARLGGGEIWLDPQRLSVSAQRPFGQRQSAPWQIPLPPRHAAQPPGRSHAWPRGQGRPRAPDRAPQCRSRSHRTHPHRTHRPSRWRYPQRRGGVHARSFAMRRTFCTLTRTRSRHAINVHDLF